MQVIFENENERNNSRKTNVVDIDIYTRRSSKCLEGKCIRRFGNRDIGV